MQRNFIGGAWVEGSGALQNVNPSDVSDVIDQFSLATPAQVGDAIAAARSAIPVWGAMTLQARSEALDAIGTAILARREVLGRLLSREEGKPLADGIGEVTRAGQLFKFYAGEVLRLAGERLPSIRAGVEVEVMPEPIGVVGLITPWNYPSSVPANKIAPAIAYGNAVVLKPSELVPASAVALFEIMEQAGLPAGLVNLVIGAADVGEALATSPEINGISFTGSTATGRKVAAHAVGNGAKVQLELGGKNPLVVLDDAPFDIAVECAVNGAFYQTGQRCTASSRLIVTEGVHDRFVAAVAERVRGLKVGHALEASTQVGPVIDERQLAKDMSYIDIARAEGARLVVGGERLNRATEGFYLSPALFADTHRDMRINREEVFGPVASVIRVKDYEEALEVANDTAYGLSAGICTTTMKYAHHFRRNVKAGMTMLNLPTAGVDYHVPFGGAKASGYGPKEQGRAARDFFTQTKTSYLPEG
ncbi:aldehyde dehydrogenase family protein [Ancylobacter lacus]|uniref:aldehyde dehydrogenase family protein n=1 Tax=Ancylobacter lacus TaxID=2579970 RepID=UPI003CCEF0F6